MGGLSVYITFISSSLMVSNFAVCGIPFLAGFYFKDFILEMFSVRYLSLVCLIICVYGFNRLLFFPFILFYAVILMLFLLIL